MSEGLIDPQIRPFQGNSLARVCSRYANPGFFLKYTTLVTGFLFIHLVQVNLWYALASLTICVGCLASWALLQFRKADSSKAWWPAYLGGWIGMIPAFLHTGGLGNPFFGAYTIILFMVGVFIQARFSVTQIFLHVLLNDAAWAILTLLGYVSIDRGNSLPLLIEMNVGFLVLAYFLTKTYVDTVNSLIREISEQGVRLREAHNSLLHSERMAETGKLLAGTAHELAQPVQVITASSALLTRSIRNGASDVKLLDTLSSRITDASNRLSQLVCQLRDFSRKEPFHLQQVDLKTAIRSIWVMVENDLRCKNIELVSDIRESELPAMADSFKIQQVLLNLINNARDAVTGQENARVELSAFFRRDWIRVTVKDNGPGIPFHVQKKLFEPYFTTKTKGMGTGLGLPICQQIIEKHGGTIRFSSHPGETVFVLDIPRSRRANVDHLESINIHQALVRQLKRRDDRQAQERQL